MLTQTSQEGSFERLSLYLAKDMRFCVEFMLSYKFYAVSKV